MKKVILIASVFFSLALYAQKTIDNQVHGWIVYQGNHK
jgi:hypothetical protein